MPLILVVEDDMEMNELQRELLSLHGMETVPAYSGRQALELCDQYSANAILLDVMLPEMDGFETCRLIRQREDGRHLPIIMLTALDSDDCRQRGLACGADAYFIKPFDPDEVVRTLLDLMGEA
ncbi:MAG: response regulator [Phycisphaerae bacterium]|nr:response regulator [Phycisphaerae bacterium]